VDNELLESCYMPAALQALKSFPVEPDDVTLVSQSENVTFRVSVCGDESDYVLRLHRPNYNSIEELESERAWTAALSKAGIAVPAALATRDGTSFELVDIPGAGHRCYVGMTRWIEGSPLSDYLETSAGMDERERLFHEIGEIAAAIHNESATWNEPPGFQRRRLDLDGLLGDNPLWGRFWEHGDLTKAEKQSLLRARDRARDALEAYGENADKFGLVHADLHPDNIVYDGDNLALIDFDDSGYGWHMYDIATALVECHFAPGFDAICASLLDGYRKHRPLKDEDVEILPTFVLMRGMAIIGWYHERPEHTGSAYFENVKNWVIGECESSPSW